MALQKRKGRRTPCSESKSSRTVRTLVCQKLPSDLSVGLIIMPSDDPHRKSLQGSVGGVVSSTLHKLNFREVKLPQTMPGVSGPVAFEPTSVRLPHFQLLQNSFPSERFLLKTTCVQSHSLEPDTLKRCWMEEKKEKEGRSPRCVAF